MAVEFQAPISEVKNTGTSITIPIPVGWSPGDLLIAYVTKDDDNTCTPPAGWTELHDVAGNTAMNLWVGWRIAVADDDEWTWSGDSEDYYGVILRYTGHDPDYPIHASGSTGSAATASAIAPSVAFGDPIPLTVGSLVLQMFGADNPPKSFPYNFPAQLTQRFNDEAGTIGGAGGDRISESHWLSPTGHNDPDTAWDYEDNAYDDDTDSHTESLVSPTSWSSYIELTIAAINCSKVRFWATYSSYDINQISVDVYYSDGWHNIYEGAYANLQWVEKEIGSTQLVTAMQMKFYNVHATGNRTVIFKEADFWKAETATGETGTVVFGMSASEEWAAATVIIEAAAGGGVQALLSTAAMETSFTSALSRGVTESLLSTANIASSITGVLTRGITQALISTSAIASSITGSLSRGVTEALTSTSAITTSITGRLTRIVDLISTSAIVTSITSLLTRGVALVSTSNIVTSITGSLSRGVTEALTSTSNITSSITSDLSRGVKELLTSTSNIATSITSALSRGITQALISTSNIATSFSAKLIRILHLTSTSVIVSSITSSLGRGITETLTSAVTITTSIVSALSRGVTQALTSTANGIVSTTGNLSRGVTETLTSTANIAVSIIATLTKQAGETIALLSTAIITSSITSSLSRGITEALNSTSNIATSITGSLSRGVKETLTSTANIAVSITASLSRGITQVLTSTVNIICGVLGFVDIGSAAIDRNASASSGYTLVSKDNPANNAGTLTSVEIYTQTALTGCKIASFYEGDANVLSTRDYLVIGDIPLGYSQHDISLEVQTGDYIGIYYISGSIDYDSDGGVGVWSKYGNYIPCTERIFGVYATWTLSLYGSGGGVFLGRGIKETLTSTANIATSIIAELTKVGAAALNSVVTITTSITSTLSRGMTEALTSTSVITTLMTGNLSRGIKAVLNTTVSITTSITSALSRGITEALTSTVNIVSSINATLKAIYHWVKVTKETADRVKVAKDTGDWSRVDKTDMGWLVNGWLIYGWLMGLWGKISKTINGWTKVDKDTGNWTKIKKG